MITTCDNVRNSNRFRCLKRIPYSPMTLKELIQIQPLLNSRVNLKSKLCSLIDLEKKVSHPDTHNYTLLPEPALLVRIEERVVQIITSILGDFERLLRDRVIDARQS